MDLSIVIVNWNTREMLSDCLASVFRGLDSLKAEVFVIDNSSTDGSAEMVATDFPAAVLIRNETNRGFAAANNQALRIASGRYLLLLNSDTVVHGDVLSRSIDYMDLNCDVAAMGCRVLNSDGSVQLTCRGYPTLFNLLLLASGLWRLSWPALFDRYAMHRWQRDDERDVAVVSGCYMVLRAEALQQVGLLDESFFLYGEETDLCRRISDAGWRLRFAPVGEITHHGEGSGSRIGFRRELLLSNGMVRLHRKHGGIMPAVTAWTILLSFNLTRAAFWTLASIVSRKDAHRERRNVFINLVRNHHKAWPTAQGVAL